RTVGDTIDFIRGFYPDWNAARCDRLLTEFALDQQDEVDALSFGSRIKLALVLALSRDAELLLLDEPTVGLDAVSRQRLFAELLAFMRREDRTIVISSHQLSELERFADHVAIVDRGKLLAAGRMDELVERYRQIEIRVTNGELVLFRGARVLRHEGDRMRLLVERDRFAKDGLAAFHAEIVAEIPL